MLKLTLCLESANDTAAFEYLHFVLTVACVLSAYKCYCHGQWASKPCLGKSGSSVEAVVVNCYLEDIYIKLQKINMIMNAESVPFSCKICEHTSWFLRHVTSVCGKP